MERRTWIGSAMAAAVGLFAVGKVKQEYYGDGGFEHWPVKYAINGPIKAKMGHDYVVEALEHWPKSEYVVHYAFVKKEDAVEFVRSLYPRIRKLVIDKRCKHIDQLRSGYRDLTRYQCQGVITDIEMEIVSKQVDGTEKVVFEKHWPGFGSIDAAWGYLDGLRVNGEFITRPSKHPKGNISEYLVRPFDVNIGKAEIVELT